MRLKVIVLFVVCFVCVISSEAQNKVQIIESDIEATYDNNKLDTSLVLKVSQTVDSAKITLKILDTKNEIIAQNVSEKNLQRGVQNLKISLEFTKLQDSYEDMLWHRLQYEISSADSEILSSGIVSLSEIMPEIFNLKVIASEEVFAGMKYKVHILTLHPSTMKPVKDVAITGELELELDVDELNLKANGKSNSEGFTTLEFDIPKDAKVSDDGEITIKGIKNGIVREADHYLDIPVNSFFYMHTDKQIYQPNQKLFVRGILLNPLKQPIADVDVDVEILDDEDEVVHSESIKTSRFGVAHFEWQIPESIKLGIYKVRIENDDDDDFGEVEFKITRYDLPNFSVNAKSNKPFYTADHKKAEIKVSADYLFGKPVTNGKVRIIQEEGVDGYIEQVEKQAEKLDDDGNFSAKFDLSKFHKELETEGYKYFKDIKFVAYFTDLTTNRTEQKRFDVRITKDPIHIYFIRSSNDANPNLPYQFYISTFYADGTPVSANLTIEGNYRDIAPFEKLASTKTNSYGASKIEIAIPDKPFPDAKDEFNFRIIAKDKDGNIGNFADNIYVNEEKKQIRIDSDKTIYKPNETIYVDVFSTEDKDSVLVDVVNESGVIYTKRVRIENGKGKTRIYYRPDFAGAITLSAYSLNDDDEYEIPYHSKAIIFPKSNKLDFNIKSLKTVYAPNEEAKINFKVRNGEGIGMETALGIIVLDKAIEERAKSEKLPDNYAGIRKLLGIGESFGNLTRRDLDNLELDNNISKDFQLAAEFLLINKSFKPKIFESDSYQSSFRYNYEDYFKRELEPLTKLLNEHYEKTDEFPKDTDSLKEILAKNNFDYESLKDAWGTPYQYQFEINRNDLIFKMTTASGDKKFSTEDDFVAKQLKFESFRGLTNKLNVILNNHILEFKQTPKTKEELIEVWKKNGFDFDSMRDNWNQPLYIETHHYQRDNQKIVFETIGKLDGERQKVQKNRFVKQEIILCKLRSKGKDNVQNTDDDFDIGNFSGVLSEEIIGDEEPLSSISKRKTTNSSGAISGIITDSTGAVIPGATVKVVNQNSNEIFETKTNESGYFIIADLPSGKYKVTGNSPGFAASSIQNIVVISMQLIEIKLMLLPTGVTVSVDVSSDVELIDTTSSGVSSSYKSDPISIAKIISSKSQISTPRVREYFPETLVWKPEIITDKNGRAEVKFKLADSLTTWKLYAIGSTQEGQIAMVEKELQTFQPFFAELDPPKILTEGDEISLPVPIRNYTEKKQNVSVEMAENNWSSLLNGSIQNIKIDADATTNAIFNFRATTPIVDGKQKVTAIAKKESDAIEKSVTVKPNGKEETYPQTKFFEKETIFDVNFPAEAFPQTKKAVVKIYPNMLSHVAESVEGLLKRPYGCGEQTTSSTYPNLMILRFEEGTNYKINPELKKKAEGFLQDGYKRLLNYQTDSGFGYWNGNNPDIALTAYVLQFLNDAKDFIEVDETVVKKAENWLLRQQKADGNWSNSYLTTAYVARSLSMSIGENEIKKESLQKALTHLKNNISETKDSYVLANLALAAIQIEDNDTANEAIAKLISTKTLPVNADRTAFNGWGKTAEIETNALIVQALLRSEERNGNLIGKGLQYLLKNKDKYGVWYSTQTTVNVLNTLILFQKMQQQTKTGSQNKAEILINGVKVKEFEIDGQALSDPLIFDASNSLDQTNRVELKGFDSLAMAQVVATYYIDWNQTQEDFTYFDLKVDYNKTKAKIGEEIICDVGIKRKIGTYGMILAEIGIPPGADVDRATLEELVKADKISRYDILPDKVIIYAWANKEAKNVQFTFKSRYGINAQTSPTLVYDYYNEEAKAVISPTRFEVK